MADDITLPGATRIVATDEDSSLRNYQWIKLAYGADGTFNKVAATDGLPVQGFVGGTDYESCPVNATTTLGATGATGDYLAGVLISPTTTSPLSVAIKDGAGTAITVFAGGASSVSNLVPFFVPVGAKSTAGAWQIVIPASANLTCLAVGDFT